MEIKEILEKMSVEDKIALCSGEDTWHTKQMEKYEIPSIMMADGPHGLRKQLDTADILGINEAVPATCFPTAVTLGCSWDVDLIYEVGSAIGEEARENGVSVLLGPGANIKRNPLCGRNFEYFSEDPYLTGKLAAAHIKGTKSQGIGASLKHFAANSQEYKRFSSDSIMDERTLREIYLTGFEMAVKEAEPATVMCAYNKLNGIYCSDNGKLLTDILREEWGFDGVVVTDWGAMNDRREAFRAGCDLCMPGGSSFMEKESLQSVREGKLSESEINRSAERILKLVNEGYKVSNDYNSKYADTMQPKKRKAKAVTCVEDCIMEKHDELCYRAAVESAVLLKNESRLLPLKEECIKKSGIAFMGYMAKELRYQGAGSSHIHPWKLTSALEAYPQAKFAEGCLSDGSTDPDKLKEAVEAAKVSEVAVVFAGLTPEYESEGFDRENMKMPEGYNKLIKEVAAVNKNTIVVLLSGSPVELSWEESVKSILYMGLPGQAGGRAIVDLLFGRANPGGKLAETWPYNYEDCISSSYYLSEKTKDAHYREGIYVGYRYYESAGKAVRYPFGYGLSYTAFKYSNLLLQGNKVYCMVKNTGKCEGKEIVQLYISPFKTKEEVYRPVREMKGFQKISLKPGESKRVSFELDDRCFAIWDDGWKIPEGRYQIQIGSSVRDIRLSMCVDKKGNASAENRKKDIPQWYYTLEGIPSHEDFECLIGRKLENRVLKKGEFTMSSSILEMKEESVVMRLFYKMVELVISSKFGWKKDYSNPTFRMMMSTAADASLNGMKINMGMKRYVFEGLLEMANGHFVKGIKKICER